MSTGINVGEAIENLYRVFEDVARPVHVDSCSCCTGEDEFRSIVQRQLSELTAEDLSRYAFKAISTVGRVEDYLYLLPRLLELTAVDDLGVNIEVTAKKIAMTEPEAWPQFRQVALDEFWLAMLQGCGRSHAYLTTEIMCAIGLCRTDIEPYLRLLEQNPGLLGDLHSACAATLAKKGRLGNAFWPRDSWAQTRIIQWFQEPETEELLVRYYENEFGSPEE